MSLSLYNALWSVAAPAGRLYLHASSKHRPLLARFSPPVPTVIARPILIHACSVGEVMTALPLVAALRQARPGTPLLLTVSTATGYKLAGERVGVETVTWLPFDARKPVRRFLDQLQPAALVLIETEIWPNLITEAARRGISIAIVNARISDRHLAGYQRFHGLFKPVFAKLHAVGAQELRYAERFTSLGADPGAVTVTGNAKFDAVKTEVEPRVRAKLRQECGFGEDPLLLFGSTRPGDEELARECFTRLREQVPRLRLLIAPRHLDRAAEVAALFAEPVYRRTEARKGTGARSARIFLIDTLGELAEFYSIASVAVIGGSFFPGVEGHNPLEPAGLGVPTVFGPFMKNFQDTVEILLRAEGAVQAPDASQLCDTLSALLSDPAEQRQLGTRARKAVLDNRGAVKRNTELVLSSIDSIRA